MTTLTDEIIQAAIEGFESQKRRIDSQIDELRQLLHTDHTEGAQTSKGPATKAPATKRKISAAGRRSMAAAQQARWAKARGETEPALSSATPKPKQKRQMSEAGRKAIGDATRKRWALKKAEAQNAPATVAKKAAAASTAKAAKKSGGK